MEAQQGKMTVFYGNLHLNKRNGQEPITPVMGCWNGSPTLTAL